MRKRMFLVSAALLAAAQATPLRVAEHTGLHCQAESTHDCTVANARADARAMAARKQYVEFMFGGPAVWQEPIEITVDELNRIGIAIWFTGDTIDQRRDAYYDEFNKMMESAFNAAHDPALLRKARQRIDVRTKAAVARLDAKRRR